VLLECALAAAAGDLRRPLAQLGGERFHAGAALVERLGLGARHGHAANSKAGLVPHRASSYNDRSAPVRQAVAPEPAI
jgi:hypothetical protein